MRCTAINGSPHGRTGRTERLVKAFLEGAEEAGAQTQEVYLSEHKIEYCRGCYSCWTTSPGRCVIEDDLALLLEALLGADVLILASPLHFLQISGQLKSFIDRLTSIGGDPHAKRATAKGEGAPGAGPRLVAISSCGFPRIEQYEALSLWMGELAGLLGMELFCEAYAEGSGRLQGAGGLGAEGLDAETLSYLDLLREAGERAGAGGSLAEGSRLRLRRGLRASSS